MTSVECWSLAPSSIVLIRNGAFFVTYDQGREMAQCGRLSEITGVAVCFADQHIPWQRQPKAVADSPAKVIVIT